MFKFKLQTQIIFSFLLVIFLSFIASVIVTNTIWQKNSEDRSIKIREKISKSISDSLATYYKSRGSFDRGFENVLLIEMTNLGLDPDIDAIGVVDEDYNWIISSPTSSALKKEFIEGMVAEEKYIISPINVDFSDNDFIEPWYGRETRRINELYRLGIVTREVAEKIIIDLQEKQSSNFNQISVTNQQSDIRIVGYLVFINKELKLEEAFNKLLLMSFVGIFLISIVVAYLISLQIASPVKKLTNATKKISGGIFEPIKNINTSSELSNLTSSFNSMVNKMSEIQLQRKQLFSDISHELRNPLTVLRVNIEGVLEKKIELNENKLIQINDQIILLSKLVDDLSLIATSESGELKLNLENIDINNLIKETFDSFKDSASEKNISFENNFRKKLVLEGDPSRVKQIIANIFSNSLKYLNSGDKLSIGFDEDEDFLYLRFIDNGPGIPPENLKRIFERFFKVDGNRNRKNVGSGLGLAITKQLCLAHGWNIEVSSELRKGTEFYISIPKS